MCAERPEGAFATSETSVKRPSGARTSLPSWSRWKNQFVPFRVSDSSSPAIRRRPRCGSVPERPPVNVVAPLAARPSGSVWDRAGSVDDDELHQKRCAADLEPGDDAGRIAR